MKIQALKRAAVITTFTLMLPYIAAANDINAQALELAGQQQFDKALSVLSQQNAQLANGYEHRFLKARICRGLVNIALQDQSLTAL